MVDVDRRAVWCHDRVQQRLAGAPRGRGRVLDGAAGGTAGAEHAHGAQRLAGRTPQARHLDKNRRHPAHARRRRHDPPVTPKNKKENLN